MLSCLFQRRSRPAATCKAAGVSLSTHALLCRTVTVHAPPPYPSQTFGDTRSCAFFDFSIFLCVRGLRQKCVSWHVVQDPQLAQKLLHRCDPCCVDRNQRGACKYTYCTYYSYEIPLYGLHSYRNFFYFSLDQCSSGHHQSLLFTGSPAINPVSSLVCERKVRRASEPRNSPQRKVACTAAPFCDVFFVFE